MKQPITDSPDHAGCLLLPRFAAERQSGIGPIRLMKDLQIDDFS
jgi:hypothetical protein